MQLPVCIPVQGVPRQTAPFLLPRKPAELRTAGDDFPTVVGKLGASWQGGGLLGGSYGEPGRSMRDSGLPGSWFADLMV